MIMMMIIIQYNNNEAMLTLLNVFCFVLLSIVVMVINK